MLNPFQRTIWIMKEKMYVIWNKLIFVLCVCVFFWTSSWKIVFQQFSLLCYLFFVVIRNVDHLHGLYNPIAGMTDVRVLRQRAFLVLSHTDANRGTSCLDRQAAWTEFRGRKIRLKNSRNQREALVFCGSSGTGWIFFRLLLQNKSTQDYESTTGVPHGHHLLSPRPGLHKPAASFCTACDQVAEKKSTCIWNDGRSPLEKLDRHGFHHANRIINKNPTNIFKNHDTVEKELNHLLFCCLPSIFFSSALPPQVYLVLMKKMVTCCKILFDISIWKQTTFIYVYISIYLYISAHIFKKTVDPDF